jgi:hypothetical protein
MLHVLPHFLLQLVLPRFHYVAEVMSMLQSIRHLAVKGLVLPLPVSVYFLDGVCVILALTHYDLLTPQHVLLLYYEHLSVL